MIKAIEEELLSWGFNRQSIWEGENIIDIPFLIQKIEDGFYKTKKFKYNIEAYNLSKDSFDCDNLFEFLVHYKLVENADLSFPIIINNMGQVIDWRHRICKAILLWKKEIDAIQILDSTVI